MLIVMLVVYEENMEEKKFTLRETIISIVVNTSIVFGITFAKSKTGYDALPFEAFGSAIYSLAPDIIIPLLFYTIIGTLITRRAINTGTITQKSSKFKHYPIIIRGLINTIVISIVMVPVTALIFCTLLSTVTEPVTIILIKCLNVAFLGAIFCPINIGIEMNTHREPR